MNHGYQHGRSGLWRWISILGLVGHVFLSLSSSCHGYAQPRVFHSSKRSNQLLEQFDKLGCINDFSYVEKESHDRRRFLGSLLAPIVALPLGVLAVEDVAVEPDYDCLLDLPPIPDDCVRIYLCRHGQTEFNRLRKVQGARVDPPTNDNGYLQSRGLGKALARVDPSPKIILHSSLQRARLTAEVAGREIDLKIKTRELQALGEIDFGPANEGQPVALAKARMRATSVAWSLGQIDLRPQGGGDSGREVRLWVYQRGTS
jgi:hypothetical protein